MKLKALGARVRICSKVHSGASNAGELQREPNCLVKWSSADDTKRELIVQKSVCGVAIMCILQLPLLVASFLRQRFYT
jgi:hypothetical protein